MASCDFLYQLKTRDSPRLTDDLQLHDFFYPAQNQLNYNNHVIGFDCNAGNLEFNLIMSNNQKSEAQMKYEPTEVRINPADGIVKRVVMFTKAGNKLLWRIEFYDKTNQMILKAGFDGGDISKEFVLEDDERIIGLKPKLYRTHQAAHYDPVFVIGKLV